MTRDFVLGLLLLIVAAAYYAVAAAIPASQLADAVGPQGLPKAYAVVLALLSILLMVRSRRTRLPLSGVSTRTLLRIAGMLTIGILYIALLPWVGYPVAIGGLIVGTSYYQGGRIDARVLAVGVMGAVVLWAVFVQLLGIQLPAGVWVDRLMGPS